MAWRLTPRDDRFYDMFAKAAENLVTGARLLEKQLSAPAEARPELASRMRETEHLGDDATHEIFSAVNTTFVTPFDREDIYALAGRLDDVLDHMDAAADLVVLYRPVEIPEGIGDQVDVLCRAADLTVYWVEINRLENEGDQAYRRMLATLFSGMYEPLELLKLKDVVEELEAAADAFEQVANTVQTIAAKDA
jgi:uncharacterized protein